MTDHREIVINPTVQDSQGIATSDGRWMQAPQNSRALNPIAKGAEVSNGELRGAEAAEFLGTLLNAPAGMVTSCLCSHDQLHGMSIEAVKKLLVEHIRDSRAQS